MASAAVELAASPLAVSLAWLRHRPAVAAALVGARTAEQLSESLAAAAAPVPVPAHLLDVLDKASEPSGEDA